jgi:DNA polymerase IIIc chi subunit
MTTRVVFFQVRNPSTKLAILAETAQSHFEKGENFLIFAEDDKAMSFVDDLLWKLPATSFLPHSKAEEATNERVAIAKVKKNLNNARYVFNLCSTPLLIDASIKIIYDFEDLTSPAKQTFSSLRYDAYKQAHFLIEAR